MGDGLGLAREEAVQALCAHYAHDHLSTGELEARFERVYQATDLDALKTVLQGLPAIGPLVAPPAALHAMAPAPGMPGSGSSLAPIESEKRFAAFLAEVKKEGEWVPARRIAARAVLGNVHLDFREVPLPPDGIEIDVETVLGDVKILLPPGIGADVACSAFLGSVEDKARGALAGAPVVRVRGGALLGSISVVTKLPKPAKMEGWRKQLKAWFGGDDEGSGGALGPRGPLT